jgi:hypothetical protein
MKVNRILTFAVIGFVGYWVYNRMRQKKSINPFAKSSSFTADENTFMDDSYSNAIGKLKGCQVYSGNVSTPIPFRLDNGDIIVKTGGGTTVVCPPNQQGIGATT